MPHLAESFTKKLIIDLGNTRSKVAVFVGDELQEIKYFDSSDPGQLLKPYLESRDLKACIISSVSMPTAPFRQFLSELKVIEFNASTPLPIVNRYASPSTLGADRLAGTVAANGLYPGKDVLIIDAGTAITYDFINKKGEYLGGGITAGVHMRFKALNAFTSRLPLVEPRYPDFLIGRNSDESILTGVMNGIRAEMDGIIEEYKLLYPDIITLFTGGDMFYFEKNLKNNIFAIPNLVLNGLNLILEYNLET